MARHLALIGTMQQSSTVLQGAPKIEHCAEKSTQASGPPSSVVGNSGYDANPHASKPTVQNSRDASFSIYLYSHAPSKHSIGAPLTERQQGVLLEQASPSSPQACGLGCGGALPPHPASSSTTRYRASMLIPVDARTLHQSEARTPRSTRGESMKGMRRGAGSGHRCALPGQP